MSEVTRSLQFDDVLLHIIFGCPQAESFAIDALAGLPFETSLRGSADSVLGLYKQEKGWRLKDYKSDAEQYFDADGDALYHFTDRLVFHIADQSHQRCCLHAAAVASPSLDSRPCRALVIPADSGSGKSSLTAWLVRNGFDYVSDELVTIDSHNRINGLARPIQIKPAGLSAIRPLISPNDSLSQVGLYSGRTSNGLAITALAGQFMAGEAELGMFLFPRYSPQATYAWRKLSSAEVGMRLMNSLVNARNLPQHGFTQMMTVARQIPAFELEYGGFDCLPSNFTTVISRELAEDI